MPERMTTVNVNDWRERARKSGEGPGTRIRNVKHQQCYLRIKVGGGGFIRQTLCRALKLLVSAGALKAKPLRASQWQ